jgi:hypothetical protein
MRASIRLILVCVCALIMAVCSSPVARTIVDAGRSLTDAIGDSAQAQSEAAMNLECMPHMWTITNSAGVVTTMTTFIAETDVAGLDPSTVTDARAVVCGHEGPGGERCPADSTCAGDIPAPIYGCTTYVLELAPGHVRVDCGYSATTNGTTLTNTYHTARVWIAR